MNSAAARTTADGASAATNRNTAMPMLPATATRGRAEAADERRRGEPGDQRARRERRDRDAVGGVGQAAGRP